MEINCWVARGEKDRVKIPNLNNQDVAALRAAIRSARDDGGTDRTVLWERPRVSEALRMTARVSLGLTCTIGVVLLLAAFVSGADTRSTLLVVLFVVVLVGGGFPLIVSATDVGIKVVADGTLERAGWGGVETVDLRTYQRVTVKRTVRRDDGARADGS